MDFMAQRINDNEVKLNDDGSLHLIPPYPLSGTGGAVYKSKNRKANYTYRGSCNGIDSSRFNEALNQQNGYH